MAPSSRRAAGAGPSSGKSGKRAPGRRAGRGTSGGARRVPGPAEKTGSRTPRRRPTAVPAARRHSTPVSSPAGRTTSGGQLEGSLPVNQSAVAAAREAAPSPALGTVERYLTLWVALCIVTGIALGSLLPGLFQAVGRAEVAQVN